ncbi:MAG TPA: RNA 2',3'-cyclic phosphodiesterase [Candidatus Moranbacteria bacterium]|nr:RNA 2',3'-cyclic phosphodiesterase [Candidatus Moranbacteria bacterium]
MQRKIFIGVDLPNDVKKRLMQKVKKWEKLPIRWSREENIHLTLISLGYVSDDLIFDICEKVKMAVGEMDVFDIDLSRIELGPTQEKDAKIVQFTGKISKELKELSENIEKKLGIFQANKKEFKPHITLGRIQQYGWQKLKSIPNVAEEFSVLLPIESVQIFESAIIDGKRKFSVIDSELLSEW